MIIGVTGGIGAGKSSVCRAFEACGALVVDADRIGHETVEVPAVLRELVAAFGEGILDGEGRLVRRELGRRAFASEASRQRLNAIVWPPLGQRLEARVRQALRKCPHRSVAIDAPVLLEWGDPDGLCEVVVVVTAPREVRLRRTVARLGISRAEVEARMASQLPEEDKIRAADYVIVNDGSPEELEEEARAIWQQITDTNLRGSEGAGTQRNWMKG